MATSCPNGAYCDPATANCGDDPCTAVECPAGQECLVGECYEAMTEPDAGPPDGGGGGSPGTGGSAGTPGTGGGGAVPDSGTGNSAGSGDSTNPKANFGLATGGGGCACDVPASGSRGRGLGLLGAALALALFRRRREPSRSTREVAR
jgi:MYXO-CTERM domain-containing protein